MDVLEVVLAIGAVLASFYVGGPLVVLAVMAALDLPSGSRQVAADFINGGGWVLLAVGGLAALGVGLYYLACHRGAELPAVRGNTEPGP